MQRWHILQHDLMPEFKQEWGALTPWLEKLVHIVDWVRTEKWSVQTWQGAQPGRTCRRAIEGRA